MFEKLKEKRAKKRPQKMRDSINAAAESMKHFAEITSVMGNSIAQQFRAMTEDQEDQNK